MKPLYETSLAKVSKKPPHKLKPLKSAVANAKLQNLESEYDTFASKQLLREMDAEMEDYMDPNKVLTEMELAFKGTATVKLSSGLASTKANDGIKGSKHGSKLEPILENGDALSQ